MQFHVVIFFVFWNYVIKKFVNHHARTLHILAPFGCNISFNMTNTKEFKVADTSEQNSFRTGNTDSIFSASWKEKRAKTL